MPRSCLLGDRDLALSLTGALHRRLAEVGFCAFKDRRTLGAFCCHVMYRQYQGLQGCLGQGSFFWPYCAPIEIPVEDACLLGCREKLQRLMWWVGILVASRSLLSGFAPAEMCADLLPILGISCSRTGIGTKHKRCRGT